MAHPQPQYPQKKNHPLNQNLQQIKMQIDKILEKMKKDPNFMPHRVELDKLSQQTLELVQKHHPLMLPQQKTLLSAVIDLTEIPVMHPMMQRVAFETALKDASKNIHQFLMSSQ